MMEFSLPYQLAMRDQAPKMFNRLRKAAPLHPAIFVRSLGDERV